MTNIDCVEKNLQLKACSSDFVVSVHIFSELSFLFDYSQFSDLLSLVFVSPSCQFELTQNKQEHKIHLI